MIRIQLSAPESQRLDDAFRHETDPRFRVRIQVVRLAARGRLHQDIADELVTTTRSVQRWLNAYLERGLDGLRPRTSPGKASHIPAELADEVKRWVIDGPASVGLDRANWTYAELAAHLKTAKGIATSRSAVHRFCRKIGVRPYRPTYRYLRGDPDQQAAAGAERDALEKKPGRANSCC